MPKIKILDENTATRIAAGEVVERPVSVVKELVENALDAGADFINIALESGGIDAITVVDNGCGISQEDVPLAFQRHATSKISDASDLCRVKTMGFRGEALPGIAAVSDLRIKTRVLESDEGFFMHVRGGRVIDSAPVGCPVGTTIMVRDLFFNTPARRKHLKSKSTEGGFVSDLVYRMALVRPGVRFVMEHPGREVFRSPGTGVLLDTMAAVYGVNVAEMMLPVSYRFGDIKLEGLAGKPVLNRSTRQHITLAVNGRLVKSAILNQAINEAYRGLMATGRYPIVILHLELPAEKIDVNIHPAKTEIKIENENHVAEIVAQAVRSALHNANLIQPARIPVKSQKYPPAAEPFQLPLSVPGTMIIAERAEQAGCEVKKDGGVIPGDDLGENNLFRYKTEQVSMQGEEPGQEKRTDRPKFPANLQVTGQLMDLYIICLGKDGLYIVDQHAAHERVLFEKFSDSLQRGNPEVQFLLEPLNVDLRAHEKELLREHADEIRSLGFVMEDFGRDNLLLRGIPSCCSPSEAERLVFDLLETIQEKGKAGDPGVEFALAASLACKAAVKSGEKLSVDSMRSLLEQLAASREPFTCPHGRPAIVSFGDKELGALFKRV